MIIYQLLLLLLLLIILNINIIHGYKNDECKSSERWYNHELLLMNNIYYSDIKESLIDTRIRYNSKFLPKWINEKYLNNKQLINNIPNIIISGMEKGGTTSLYFLLCKANNIECFVKESYPNMLTYYSFENTKKYRLMACLMPSKISILYNKEATQILVLRNPINWIFSYFKYFCWYNCENGYCKYNDDRDMMRESIDFINKPYDGFNRTLEYFVDLILDDKLSKKHGWDIWTNTISKYYFNIIQTTIALKTKKVLFLETDLIKRNPTLVLKALEQNLDIDIPNWAEINDLNGQRDKRHDVSDLDSLFKKISIDAYCKLKQNFLNDCLFVESVLQVKWNCNPIECKHIANKDLYIDRMHIHKKSLEHYDLKSYQSGLLLYEWVNN